MDPQLVGDGIARHIAQAVGASDCALSSWDRPGDRVVTLGYFPVDRRGKLLPSYSLADYPTTRTILEQQRHAIIDVDDPDADPAEVGYLKSIGHRSMVILPLVAAGTTIGTIELTSERSGAFDARQVEIASLAIRGLENAEIATQLGITCNTLKRHVRLLLSKCGAPTLRALARTYYSQSESAVRLAGAPAMIPL